MMIEESLLRCIQASNDTEAMSMLMYLVKQNIGYNVPELGTDVTDNSAPSLVRKLAIRFWIFPVR
jgi:hypothetical protein